MSGQRGDGACGRAASRWGLPPSGGPDAVLRSDLREANPEPRFADFGDGAAYRMAWYQWRAINRDHEMNYAESVVRWAGIEAALRRRMGMPPAQDAP